MNDNDCGSEVMTEEVYFYRNMQEAIEDMNLMRVERACDMAFNIDVCPDGRIKMTVKTLKIW